MHTAADLSAIVGKRRGGWAWPERAKCGRRARAVRRRSSGNLTATLPSAHARAGAAGPPGGTQLDSEVGTGTYIPRPASHLCRLERIVRAQRAQEIAAAAEANFRLGLQMDADFVKTSG